MYIQATTVKLLSFNGLWTAITGEVRTVAFIGTFWLYIKLLLIVSIYCCDKAWLIMSDIVKPQ